ncbi:Family of uncharacterised function (DUF490) [Raoultella ornithinolytica]|nr:Family of uncharacterised function (DUF490) [Raoultella ornithinolytica]
MGAYRRQRVPESAVGVSSDEVMLDKNLQPIQQQSAGIPINSNLTIHVGNNVRLSAFGLKARLTGDLKVAQDKQGLGLNGQLISRKVASMPTVRT